jgi:hypothetical protein
MILNKRGQGIVEMLLIACVFMIFAAFITKGLKNAQVVAQLVDGPWNIMRGMITNGVWGTPEKTKILHPNYLRRHISFEAEEVR